jgi:hypothetical protein
MKLLIQPRTGSRPSWPRSGAPGRSSISSSSDSIEPSNTDLNKMEVKQTVKAAVKEGFRERVEEILSESVEP